MRRESALITEIIFLKNVTMYKHYNVKMLQLVFICNIYINKDKKYGRKDIW